MKLYFVVAVLCKVVETFSQNSKSNSLQKAFVDLAGALASRNHLVAVVEGPATNEASEFDFFATAAGIPHVVTKLKNERKLHSLNSSAIISMESVK